MLETRYCGLLRDPEVARDFPIRLAFGDQAQDLGLPPGQPRLFLSLAPAGNAVNVAPHEHRLFEGLSDGSREILGLRALRDVGGSTRT